MTTILTQKVVYTVEVHEAEEGGYWAEVLELPGCVSQGETLEELRANIREAIEAVTEAELEGGQPHITLQLPSPPPKEHVEIRLVEPKTAEQWQIGEGDAYPVTTTV